MDGWVGKRYRSAKLAATRQSIQWENEYPDLSTDHKARQNLFDRHDVTDSPRRM
jgi:hypothetical protein